MSLKDYDWVAYAQSHAGIKAEIRTLFPDDDPRRKDPPVLHLRYRVGEHTIHQVISIALLERAYDPALIIDARVNHMREAMNTALATS